MLTPSERHVPQTKARWRASGFDAHVAPLSPYEEEDPAAVRRAAQALRAGQAGLVVMDCIGFRRKTRDEMADLTGAPTLVANLLAARVARPLSERSPAERTDSVLLATERTDSVRTDSVAPGRDVC